MLNNDFLRGYVQALDNIDSMVKSRIKYASSLYEEGLSSQDTMDEIVSYLKSVESYISLTKENYKQLVKDLNEN